VASGKSKDGNIHNAHLQLTTSNLPLTNPFYAISHALWVNFINPDGMEIDEALYHVQRLQVTGDR